MRTAAAGRCLDELGGTHTSPEDGAAAEICLMGPIKTLWASVQGDPVFMRRVNGWLTIFWLAMMPISIATGWVKSVAYVSALSLWASSQGTGPHGRPRASR